MNPTIVKQLCLLNFSISLISQQAHAKPMVMCSNLVTSIVSVNFYGSCCCCCHRCCLFSFSFVCILFIFILIGSYFCSLITYFCDAVLSWAGNQLIDMPVCYVVYVHVHIIISFAVDQCENCWMRTKFIHLTRSTEWIFTKQTNKQKYMNGWNGTMFKLWFQQFEQI